MRKVVWATRHSWGFELELACGHDRFFFTQQEEPPRVAGCYDCAYPKPGEESEAETADSAGRIAWEEDGVARRGTE
jgi:hypothetical protein